MKVKIHSSFLSISILCYIGFLTIPMESLYAQSVAGETISTYRTVPVLNYKEIQPLTVGDQVPAIEINNVINYISDKISLPPHNKKMVIVDFFATYCTSCIKALPRFDSLQKLYGDRLQIILVTNEDEQKVKPFFQRVKFLKSVKLPIVTSDSILLKIFPHRFISHEVWINEKGFIVAITGSDYVTAKNIDAMFGSANLNWPVKNDFAEFDYTQPLLGYNSVNTQNFSFPSTKFYATLTGHIPNVPRNTKDVVDSSNSTVRTFMINYPIVNMFLRAFGKRPSFPLSHVIIDVKAKGRLIPGTSDDWELEHTYTYDAIFPASMKENERLEKIRYDLEFYFKLKGQFEKRELECLILKRNGNSDVLLYQYTEKVRRQEYQHLSESENRPVSIANLLNQLNRKHYSLPFMDESGYMGEMYVALETNSFSDLNYINKELKKYGLELIKEKRKVEMFVLSDVK